MGSKFIALGALGALLLTGQTFAAGIEDAITFTGDFTLLFNGKPLDPTVQGTNRLIVSETYQLGSSQLALIAEQGGEACPTQLWLVESDGKTAKATPKFGTCSDAYDPKKTGDSITITMPGFQGPANPKAAQAKAAKERHVFVYKAGTLTEDGKPVK